MNKPWVEWKSLYSKLFQHRSKEPAALPKLKHSMIHKGILHHFMFQRVVRLRLKKHISKIKNDSDAAKHSYIQWTIRIMHFRVKVRPFCNSVIQQFKCAFLFLILGCSLYHYFSPFSHVSTYHIFISDTLPLPLPLQINKHSAITNINDQMNKKSLTTHWRDTPNLFCMWKYFEWRRWGVKR